MFVLAESNQLYVGDMLFYLISFIILAALVWHFAWKPVTDMMEKRAKRVANDIDSAQENRKKAATMAAQREAELKGSKQEAAKIVSDAKRSGENQRTKIVEAAQNDGTGSN